MTLESITLEKKEEILDAISSLVAHSEIEGLFDMGNGAWRVQYKNALGEIQHRLIEKPVSLLKLGNLVQIINTQDGYLIAMRNVKVDADRFMKTFEDNERHKLN